MDKFYHSVRLDEELCKGCINCLKRCPTQAIRVQDGKARINKKFCIDCGECIRVCPHHAKHAVYDRLEEMERFRYKVALPAPSLYSQFNNLDDINVVLHALLLMGFDDVFEVSAAAELVSEATRAYLTEHEASADQHGMSKRGTADPGAFSESNPASAPLKSAGGGGSGPGGETGYGKDRTSQRGYRHLFYLAVSVQGDLRKVTDWNRKK